MDGDVTHGRIEVPVACNWEGLTAEQKVRQRSLHGQMSAAVEEARELADGHAFRQSPDRSVLLAIA